MAKLYYFYGTMNSGKSINLSKDAFNYEESGMGAIVLKPSIDSRGEEGYISNRIKEMSRKAYLFDQDEDLYIKLLKLMDTMLESGKEVGAIFIDEAQFLSREQVLQISHIPDFHDIPVLCYGLRTDAFGHAFEGSLALFELADEMKEIKGMCAQTRKKATMVYRLDEEGNVVTKGNSLQIGGNDKYKACSRRVYKQKVLGINGYDDIVNKN